MTFLPKCISAAAACALLSFPAFAQPRAIPGTTIYGVTVDSITGLSATVAALKNLSHMATTRVVFDENVGSNTYITPVKTLRPVSYIMGEILDSQYMTTCDQACYDNRTNDYLGNLGSYVDVWEVGNEVNGEWAATTGSVPTAAQTAAVVAKIHDAFLKVKSIGGKTALTLYWNGPPDDGSHSCWSAKQNSMLTWAQANIPDDMKQGLDYVLVSYYDQDCGPVAQASKANPQQYWHDNVFVPLQQMFPSSHVGFGENGAHKAASNSVKTQYMQTYYGLHFADLPGYIGGHFWWYWKEDCVPYDTKPLWTTFNNVIGAN